MLDHTAEYQRRICRAIDFINSHLKESPSVSQIAAAAPFSVFHFQRLFRAVIGESVAEFTRRVRLETAARRLLARPDEEITDVALDLGFSSSQNFAKGFKQHFGVSPTQYRQQSSPTAELDASSMVRTAARISSSLSSPPKVPVVVRPLPEMRVVYRRHFGSYAETGVQAAFDELQRWAEARQLHRDDGYVGIPWDDLDVTPQEKCRFDAGLIIDKDVWPGSGVNTLMIPAGRYAVLRTEVIGHDFDEPWMRLMQHWLPTSGYQPADGLRFERYFTDGSQHPQGQWDLEICLPVVPL